MKTCCFTGPRPFKLGFTDDSSPACIELKKKINNEIEKLFQRGFTHFISGMAEGVDIYCAEAVIELKKKYKDVILTAVFPYNHKGKDRCEKEIHQRKMRGKEDRRSQEACRKERIVHCPCRKRQGCLSRWRLQRVES
jgi:uncharacterized phage-like protein YoqJ